MKIDETLLTRLEKLSFLEVDVEKRSEVIAQLSEIVGFADNLKELDTEKIDATFAMDDRASTLRDDTPACDTSINDAIVENAPNSQDHFFIVPKIIE